MGCRAARTAVLRGGTAGVALNSDIDACGDRFQLADAFLQVRQFDPAAGRGAEFSLAHDRLPCFSAVAVSVTGCSTDSVASPTPGVAEAEAETARLRARQTRELAAREGVEVRDQLTAAEARFEASQSTAAQALRAYEIAEIRMREGLSTLTDLSDVRLQLEQSEANRAQAARDVQVARLRALLLRDLPLGAGAAMGGAF